MNMNTRMLFEAYKEDASIESKQPIIRTGYYYIGVIYPKNAQNGEHIALVFWSQLDPVFTNTKIFKFDLSTLFNTYSKSENKGIKPSQLNGSIIQVTKITPINSNYISYPYQVDWEITEKTAQTKHFKTEMFQPSAESEMLEIPEEDIQENSFTEELEIPEEIIDEQFLDELDQLLYDEQISKQIDDDFENELLQLIWDEQRPDRPTELGSEEEGL